MEKTKSWYMRLRMSDRFANEMNCFTLGGSLIPPKSKFGGIATPARGTSCGKPCQYWALRGVKRKWF